MEHTNPTEHNGYTISASARKLPSGKWSGSCLIKKDGEVVFRGANANSLDTRAAAEHHAIAIGRVIANGDIVGLP